MWALCDSMKAAGPWTLSDLVRKVSMPVNASLHFRELGGDR